MAQSQAWTIIKPSFLAQGQAYEYTNSSPLDEEDEENIGVIDYCEIVCILSFILDWIITGVVYSDELILLYKNEL